MTKTIDELRQAWVDARDACDRAQCAMHIAWSAYDLAVNAHLESMDEAARLKPATKEPTP